MTEFSFIVPVYNRPEEVKELLDSFPVQAGLYYEVIIVEDGSTILCDHIVKEFERLPVKYHVQKNKGPGPARNTGASLAVGKWLIFLDSDTLLTDQYFEALKQVSQDNELVFFGGPDMAHKSFSVIQRAISYSMTSFLSTGGIRGSNRSMEKFKPRSFNMGILKTAFESIGGFSNLRFGEDMDLSLRLESANYKGKLLSNAAVYHKRRATFKQFFKQVFNSGVARIVLVERHARSIKLVHLLPVGFILFHVLIGSVSFIYPLGWVFIGFYPVIFLIVSISENRSLKVGIMSVIAVYVQLFGYGLGFIKAAFDKYILKKPIKYAYLKTFYEG